MLFELFSTSEFVTTIFKAGSSSALSFLAGVFIITLYTLYKEADRVLFSMHLFFNLAWFCVLSGSLAFFTSLKLKGGTTNYFVFIQPTNAGWEPEIGRLIIAIGLIILFLCTTATYRPPNMNKELESHTQDDRGFWNVLIFTQDWLSRLP